MNAPNTIKKANRRRWLLLGLGVISILGLTLMNVFSLWELHKLSVETSEDTKRAQLRQVRLEVGERVYSNVRDLWQMDMSQVEQYMIENRQLPDSLMSVISAVGSDSLFERVYFTDRVLPVCDSGGPLMAFNKETQQLEWVNSYPSHICDGLELVRTKTKTLLTGDYRWFTKTEWDGSRTMNIALVNTEKQTVVGYLAIELNSRWLLENVVTKILEREFGSNSESGMTVWVRDWLRDEIVATNNINMAYDASNIDIRERFTFENWQFQAVINNSPTILAANNQFVGNLIFLGIAVILLLTSIFFIFRTASRERELAMRQAGFLANVTHELKTPLAVMQAAGENLADGRVRDSDRLAHYGHHIHEEAVRLSRMIDKLLNVARTDAGQILIHRRPTRLVDIVHEFYNSSESYFKDRGFEVRIRCESKDFIHADPESILTILSNLVENAIKYSADDKRVIIHIFRVKERLLLEVEDFGIGIPANKQKYIFDKFYRVEDPLTATTKGHGLGLSIVKHLTQLNGGKIELRSVYGTGSTFTLSFPLWVPEPTSVPENISSQESTPEYAVQG